jgi:aldehyde:ferredoxin oxidoreductase
MRCGARDWTLKRGINNIFGVTAKDDCLPKRIMTPLTEGAGAGSIPDVAKLKSEYYALRGLDERGFPREEKLRELGLDELGERLYST